MNHNTVPISNNPLEASCLSVNLGGHKVLDISSLQVQPNEVLVIIGPNGSGKTTFLLSLALLLKPASGTLLYRGHAVNGKSDLLRLRRQFAVVFQDPLLLNSTVWDNVMLGLRLRGVARKDAEERAKKWLQRFGIASLAQRQAKALSGGEAKRVSLARAFVLQPDILFMDEPFAALDSPTHQTLIEDFDTILRETKVSTVMVTHDRNEAVVLASRVAVLIDGSIRQIGRPEDVFTYPIDEEVANFVQVGNIIHGVVSVQNDGLATLSIGERRIEAVSGLNTGAKVTIFLKHEDVTVSLPISQTITSSARNNLTGKIVKMFAIGSQIRVTVDCGFPLVSIITKRSWEDLRFSQGQEVVVSFKASSVHLIPSGNIPPAPNSCIIN